jgi:hypothetical protein
MVPVSDKIYSKPGLEPEPELEPEPQFGFAVPRSRSRNKYFGSATLAVTVTLSNFDTNKCFQLNLLHKLFDTFSISAGKVRGSC